MGRTHLDTISDVAKHGYDLEIFCRACGHRLIVTPDVFFAHSVLTEIAVLERRLRCRRCGARQASVTATSFGLSRGKRPAKDWGDRS